MIFPLHCLESVYSKIIWISRKYEFYSNSKWLEIKLYTWGLNRVIKFLMAKKCKSFTEEWAMCSKNVYQGFKHGFATRGLIRKDSPWVETYWFAVTEKFWTQWLIKMEMLTVYGDFYKPRKTWFIPTFCKRINRTSTAVGNWWQLLKKGDERLLMQQNLYTATTTTTTTTTTINRVLPQMEQTTNWKSSKKSSMFW